MSNKYKLLKNAFIGLKEIHKKALNGYYDIKTLNYHSDIIEGFHNLKDFDIIQKHILKEIGGL